MRWLQTASDEVLLVVQSGISGLVFAGWGFVTGDSWQRALVTAVVSGAVFGVIFTLTTRRFRLRKRREVAGLDRVAGLAAVRAARSGKPSDDPRTRAAAARVSRSALDGSLRRYRIIVATFGVFLALGLVIAVVDPGWATLFGVAVFLAAMIGSATEPARRRRRIAVLTGATDSTG